MWTPLFLDQLEEIGIDMDKLSEDWMTNLPEKKSFMDFLRRNSVMPAGPDDVVGWPLFSDARSCALALWFERRRSSRQVILCSVDVDASNICQNLQLVEDSAAAWWQLTGTSKFPKVEVHRGEVELRMTKPPVHIADQLDAAALQTAKESQHAVHKKYKNLQKQMTDAESEARWLARVMKQLKAPREEAAPEPDVRALQQ